MSSRIVLSGLAAGLVSALLARMWIVLQIADWNVPALRTAVSLPAAGRPWLGTGIWIAVGLVVFTAGWSAARWAWAGSKTASFAAGALTGLLAGAVLLLYPLQFWAILEPQQFILENARRLSLLNHERIALAYFVNVRIMADIVQVFANLLFWLPLLGGLGGWVSFLLEKEGWGSEPEPPGWIHRLPAYALTLNGAVVLVVSVVIGYLFNELLTLMLLEARSFPLRPEISRLMEFSESGLALLFGVKIIYLTALLLWLLPLMVTLGWLLRHIPRYKVRHRAGWLLWFLLWSGFGLLAALPIAQTLQPANRFIANVPAFLGGFSWVVLLGFGALALLAGLLGAPEVSPAPQAPPSFLAWLSAGLGFAVLAAGQWTAGIVALLAAVYLQEMNLSNYYGKSALINIPVYAQAMERTPVLSAVIVLAVSLMGFFVLAGFIALARALKRVLCSPD